MKAYVLVLVAGFFVVPRVSWADEAPVSDASGADAPDPAKTQDGTAAPPGDPPADPNPEEKYGSNEDGTPQTAVDPNKTKFYLGARFRDFVIPSFMFNLFVDGGPGVVNVFSGGPELMVQMGPLETIVSITIPYADFSMNEFVFKSSTDPDQAYEIVSSSLKLITASVDLMGRIKLEKKGTVALLLGGGVGISGVLGDIRRTQAYPDDPNNIDPDDPAKWNKCRSPNDPRGTQTPDGVAYCGTDNDHYPDSNGEDYTEDYWTDGGSKPVIFPYVALPHIALEVVPIEQLMLRADFGFSITGFFFGLAAGGKLPI